MTDTNAEDKELSSQLADAMIGAAHAFAEDDTINANVLINALGHIMVGLFTKIGGIDQNERLAAFDRFAAFTRAIIEREGKSEQ